MLAFKRLPSDKLHLLKSVLGCIVAGLICMARRNVQIAFARYSSSRMIGGSMRIEPEISGITLVAIGDLSPRQFLPDFFLRHDLLTEQEVQAVDLQLVHAQLTQWKTDWFQLQVEPERITFVTTQAPFVRLRDLVVRLFKDAAPDTPLAMLGINREIHFRVINSAARDRIGTALAPREPWGDWGKHLDGTDLRSHGGMLSLVMVQRGLDDRPTGHIQVTVQPSVKIKPLDVGVYVQVNDHYAVGDASKPSGSSEIIRLLELNFEKSLVRADQIVDEVMKLSVCGAEDVNSFARVIHPNIHVAASSRMASTSVSFPSGLRGT